MFNPMAMGMNPQFMEQMLTNPAIQDMMQSMMGNPELMMAMLRANPSTAAMVNSNPAMFDGLIRSGAFRTMASPENMRAILALQQSMAHSGALTPPTATTPESAHAMGELHRAIMASFAPGAVPTGAAPLSTSSAPAGMPTSTASSGAAAPSPAPAFPFGFPFVPPAAPSAVPHAASDAAAPVPSISPDVLYAEQLRQLADMGFVDRDRNIRALQQSQGNVNFAVERLLSEGFR